MTPEPDEETLREMLGELPEAPYWLPASLPLKSPADVLPDLARKAVSSLVADFKRPEYRAGFCVGVLLTIMLERQGMRPLPATLFGVMASFSVERLYVMAADVHETALAQREYLERQSGEAR